MRLVPIGLLPLFFVFVFGCGSAQKVNSPDGRSHALSGKASWYGEKFHGRKTASGELFDTAGFTAAHRTLPFGTEVRVTETNSRKTVVVRINDRGPFSDGRVIDLSEAAARDLEMIVKGVTNVTLEVLAWP